MTVLGLSISHLVYPTSMVQNHNLVIYLGKFYATNSRRKGGNGDECDVVVNISAMSSKVLV
jgi:hypothetical protein